MSQARGRAPAHGKALIVGRHIVTLDPATPAASAVAVADGRVVAAGRVEDLHAWRDAGTRVERLPDDAWLYPGFVESHAHLMGVGRQMEQLYVGSPPCRSIADILELVRGEAARRMPGEWVVGGHYDDTLLAEGRPPTADELSLAAPGHPVYLSHMSGHLAVANRTALVRAGIGSDTDVVGVMRDGRGDLTGELREGEAMALVSRLLPEPTTRDRVRWITRATAAALLNGVTAMCEAGFGGADIDATRAAWDAYLAADADGGLGVRTQVFPVFRARRFVPASHETPFLAVGPVKLFSDGSIQGHTGALREAYHDQPAEHGRLFWQRGDLVDALRTLRAEGRQVATHANGDAAIDLVLDAYEAVLGGVRDFDHRWRVEHAQAARSDQIERMARLRVLPSFFVGHVEVFGDRHRELFLGPERGRNISPTGWAMARGLMFSLHSDAPVTPVDPLRSIATAVTRRTSGGAVLGPGQAISPLAALRAYTSWAAWLGRREASVGSLRPGAWADAVLLSAPIEAVAGDEPPVVRGVFRQAEAVDLDAERAVAAGT